MSEVIRTTRDETIRLLRKADGRYVVMAAGEVILETSVFSAAEILYEEEVEKTKAASRELRRREQAHADVRAILSESSSRRGLEARRKGGKGRI